MGRRRSPVKHTNRHVQELVVVSGHFFTESSTLKMAKRKKVVKGRGSKSSKKRTYKGRGPSGKPKHSKVAKMIKLAKMRARKGKVRKVVKSKKKRV